MDAFASARVPAEMKNQVGERLKEISVTQSQLVNAAFAYVMAAGGLPKVKADYLVTRDEIGFLHARVPVVSPTELFGVLETRGLAYKEIAV